MHVTCGCARDLTDGIEHTKVPFVDNAPVLELLSSKNGLLILLDDEVKVKTGDDAKWLSKCEERHASSAAYLGPKAVQKRDGFAVVHYAGTVQYDSRGMRSKNADPLSENLHDLLAGEKLQGEEAALGALLQQALVHGVDGGLVAEEIVLRVRVSASQLAAGRGGVSLSMRWAGACCT